MAKAPIRPMEECVAQRQSETEKAGKENKGTDVEETVPTEIH